MLIEVDIKRRQDVFFFVFSCNYICIMDSV